MKQQKKQPLGWLKSLLMAGAVLLATLAVASCGSSGGGGSGGGATSGDGGQPGSVFSFGVITQLGSITVNGVTFNTDAAAVVVDGVSATAADDLQEGMVVEVEGEIHADGVTGTADVVRFSDSVEGPVTAAPNAASGTLEVLGQTVFIDDVTRIVNNGVTAGVDALTLGQFVGVSGQVDETGDIRATLIELKPDGPVQLNSTIETAGATSFTLGALTVNWTAGVLQDFAAGTSPAQADVVEVKGDFNQATNSIDATSVELKGAFATHDNTELEGFVTAGDSNSFTMMSERGSLSVNAANASFIGGDKAELIVGNKVEVEGEMLGDSLTARKVKFRESIRIEAVAGASSGLLNLLKLSYDVNAKTRIDDKRNAPVGTADIAAFLASIQPNQALRIRGRLNSAGSVIATRLEVDDPGSNLDRVTLQGKIDMNDGGTLSLLGVTVTVGGTSTDDSASSAPFQDIDDNALTQAEFFAKATLGTTIKVKGSMSADNQMAASEFEIQD